MLVFAGVFRLTFATLPGLFSTDVFSYVMYGRIAAVYGQNPYVQPPASFPDDPFLAWVFPFWRDQPSVYGPLWTDFSWLLSRVTGSWSNFDQVMAYRLSLSCSKWQRSACCGGCCEDSRQRTAHRAAH